MPPKKVTPKGRAAKPAGSDALPAPKAVAKKPAETKTAAPVHQFIRSIRSVQISRITFGSGREISLEPRGQRGDLVAISEEELDDPIFLNNVDLLFEVISAEEAKEIRLNQSTNATTNRSQRPEDLLTNELGKKMESVTLQPSNIEQSVVVARTAEANEENSRRSALDEIEITPVGPSFANVPGSIGNN